MSENLTIENFCAAVAAGPTELIRLPQKDELLRMRKGLRRRAIPSLELLPKEYGYEGIGRFEKLASSTGVTFIWTVEGGNSKRLSFDDMCNNPANEYDRLEFGWMIANFARLDGARHLSRLRPDSYSDYHQNEFNRRYAQEQRHYLQIENEWRHWAVVKSGHMKNSD